MLCFPPLDPTMGLCLIPEIQECVLGIAFSLDLGTLCAAMLLFVMDIKTEGYNKQSDRTQCFKPVLSCVHFLRLHAIWFPKETKTAR